MSNQVLYLAAIAAGAIFFLLVGYLGATLMSKGRVPAKTEAKPFNMKPARRLLSQEDFEYLAKQPGFRPELARKLRADRARFFRLYLNQMSREFGRLHHTLRQLTLQAGMDRPEISRALLEQQVLFGAHMAKARVNLAFFQFGVKPVEVHHLVEMLDGMQRQVNQLSQPLAVGSRA